MTLEMRKWKNNKSGNMRINWLLLKGGEWSGTAKSYDHQISQRQSCKELYRKKEGWTDTESGG